MYFLAKSEKLKGLAGASGMSALFGITEPAIFGVNLRLRWPFYIGMGASAIASTMIAIFDVKATKFSRVILWLSSISTQSRLLDTR